MGFGKHLFVILLLYGACAWADQGTELGRTYPIAEPDVLQEMKQRAAGIDWRAKLRAIDVRKRARGGSIRLPKAQSEAEYPLDLTYTLPFDIPDGKGGVLYPKGYRFNPVKYVHLPYKLGIIGPTPEELAWARRQEGTIVWMTAGGDPYALGEKLGTSVYLFTPQMAERFQVRATPTLVSQVGDTLVAHQFVAEGTKGGSQ